jgi:hypothetical protein
VAQRYLRLSVSGKVRDDRLSSFLSPQHETLQVRNDEGVMPSSLELSVRLRRPCASLHRFIAALLHFCRVGLRGSMQHAAFSNVGKTVLLERRQYCLNWTNGRIFSGTPLPSPAWLSSSGGSELVEGCLLIRAGHQRAHRNRAERTWDLGPSPCPD